MSYSRNNTGQWRGSATSSYNNNNSNDYNYNNNNHNSNNNNNNNNNNNCNYNSNNNNYNSFNSDNNIKSNYNNHNIYTPDNNYTHFNNYSSNEYNLYNQNRGYNSYHSSYNNNSSYSYNHHQTNSYNINNNNNNNNNSNNSNNNDNNNNISTFNDNYKSVGPSMNNCPPQHSAKRYLTANHNERLDGESDMDVVRRIVDTFVAGNKLSEFVIPPQGIKAKPFIKYCKECGIAFDKVSFRLSKLSEESASVRLKDAIELVLLEKPKKEMTGNELLKTLVARYPLTIKEIPKQTVKWKDLLAFIDKNYSSQFQSFGSAPTMIGFTLDGPARSSNALASSTSATKTTRPVPIPKSVILDLDVKEVHGTVSHLLKPLQLIEQRNSRAGLHSNQTRGKFQQSEAQKRVASSALKQKENDQQYMNMRKKRSQLQTFKDRKELIDCIAENQVVVIVGETGCGKTTQLPQLVLDDLVLREEDCQIVCTQPRRFSAISVADRVAAERCDPIGTTIGYHIRFEQKYNDDTQLLFCTLGVLLKIIETDPLLLGYTHVFVDEVHERDTSTDFFLLILRTTLKKNPNLKVILMSATINQTIFVDYFADFNPAVKEIKGKTNYPIREYYLEDYLQLSNFVVYPSRKKTNDFDVLPDDPPPLKPEEYEKELGVSALIAGQLSLVSSQINTVDVQLVCSIIHHIVRSGEPGSILVFLPGMKEQKDVAKELSRDHRFWVLLLHSSLPMAEQKLVFKVPSPGKTKVVLSTNIAETSVTIDDIVHVIDSGKTKLQLYLTEQHIPALMTRPISKANGHQRRGRAGRCRPGNIYRMYSRLDWDRFPANEEPEMMRIPAEELCLLVKTHKLGNIEENLGLTLSPPRAESIKLAIETLTRMGALCENQDLTHLGEKLALMPLHPQLGKLLLYGHLFGCLDAMCVITAMFSGNSPFYVPYGRETEARNSKYELGKGTLSDPITAYRAYRVWKEQSTNDDRVCEELFLSSSRMIYIEKLRQNLNSMCTRLNLYDRGVTDDAVLRTVLCAGLWPNVLSTNEHNKKRVTTMKGDKEIDMEIHSQSVNASLPKPLHKHLYPSLLVYYKSMRTSLNYTFDSSFVFPLDLLLFGSGLEITHEIDNRVYIQIRNTRDLHISMFKKDFELYMTLKKEISQLCDYSLGNLINQETIAAFTRINQMICRLSPQIPADLLEKPKTKNKNNKSNKRAAERANP